MKRASTIFFLNILLIAGLLAKPVDQNRAKEIALAFIPTWSNALETGIEDIQAHRLPDGTISYYVLHLIDKGWIMVSGDDVVQPILAFSFENDFAPEEEWSDAGRYLLDGYKTQIKRAAANKSLTRHSGWTELKQSVEKKSANTTIEPFIDVLWNQGNGWNRFCPEDEDGPGGHAYVGCVAVAMAQAMSVYSYPVRSQGVASYVSENYGSIAVDFNKQDPYEWNMMSKTSSDNHNARLLYHCAVSCSMGFGADGSGAYVRDAAVSMKKYFSYSTTTQFVTRYADEAAWEELLINELAAGRPLVYRGEPGNGTAGHAWNVDGYGGGYFHMNFGWSGSQNGHYTLNLIDPGSYDFTTNQGAIIGIRPPESAPYDIKLSASSIYENQPEGTFVAAMTIEDEDPSNTYSCTCWGRFNVILDRRAVSDDFYIENDTLWTKRLIEYNSENLDRNFKDILIEVKDQYNNVFKKEFDIEVMQSQSGGTSLNTYISEKPFFYPNPANDYLRFKDDGQMHSIRMYDLTGKEVLKGSFRNTIDISVLKEGIYVLMLDTRSGTQTQKIVIQR